LHISDSFEYPIKKVDINTAHLKFADWGTSGGKSSNDWYLIYLDTEHLLKL
jgi:LruC domain-containing protein